MTAVGWIPVKPEDWEDMNSSAMIWIARHGSSEIRKFLPGGSSALESTQMTPAFDFFI